MTENKKKKKTIVQYIYELSLVEKQTINNKGIDISQSNQSVKNQKEIVCFREKKMELCIGSFELVCKAL